MDFISRVFGVGGGRGPTPVGGLTPQERATSLLGLRGSGQFREGLEGLKDLTLQDRVQVLQILMEHKDLQHEVRTTQAVFERATEFFGGESKQDVLFKTAQLYQHELVFSPQ
ncbi:MAG: hypothetical protein FJZ58_08240, partial [Chlamydiae bacterium]|nr:hypothetical protein [Chlamydiota bacterium]